MLVIMTTVIILCALRARHNQAKLQLRQFRAVLGKPFIKIVKQQTWLHRNYVVTLFQWEFKQISVRVCCLVSKNEDEINDIWKMTMNLYIQFHYCEFYLWLQYILTSVMKLLLHITLDVSVAVNLRHEFH